MGDDTIGREAAVLAAALAEWPEVMAVAVGGSHASGTADPGSDIDLYAYVSSDIPIARRASLLNGRGRAVEIDNRFWEPGDEWDDEPAGVHVDLMYRSPAWAEGELAAVLDRHEARLGYTTCVWHNLLTSRPLFDRSGWFRDLQARARQPYPDGLAAAIVAKNRPVLRGIAGSYRAQIAKAAERGDAVSVNHRIAAFLASYFDIVFAVNRRTHPGEKRLVRAASALPCLPVSFAERIDRLLTLAPAGEPTGLCGAVDALCDGLDDCLLRAGA